MTLNKRKLATAGVLAVILAGGGASVAAAAGNSATTAPPAIDAQSDQQQSEGETADGPDGGPGSAGESGDPGYVGSVPAPADNRQDGHETAGEESQEQDALQSLATVTPSQAERAALAAVPGTVAQAQLDDENGFVVYSVEIKGSDGTATDVKVDAGNGTVLDRQAGGDGETSDGADRPESPTDAPD
ncbi:MAG: hypothetical protein JWR45_988 [Blastococcus sp.]|nr:hypothetical protein [Blastococcus sp.]